MNVINNNLTSYVKKYGASITQVILMSLFLSSPAFAQFQAVNTKMSTIQVALMSLGGVIATIAFLWCAFKMMFQHAKFSDVATIMIGGVIAGLAGVLGGWIVG